jgi:hypothetical protein
MPELASEGKAEDSKLGMVGGKRVSIRMCIAGQTIALAASAK